MRFDAEGKEILRQQTLAILFPGEDPNRAPDLRHLLRGALGQANLSWNAVQDEMRRAYPRDKRAFGVETLLKTLKRFLNSQENQEAKLSWGETFEQGFSAFLEVVRDYCQDKKITLSLSATHPSRELQFPVWGKLTPVTPVDVDVAVREVAGPHRRAARAQP